MTDNDKALVERLRHFSKNCKDEYLHELSGRSADRICELLTENAAQAAEIAELKSWKAAEDAHHHKLRAEIERLRAALTYAWDLVEEANYSDSVMMVKKDRFLSTYFDENGLRAALGESQ